MKKSSLIVLSLVLCLVLPTLSFPLVSGIEDSWTTIEPMPTLRENFELVVLNNRIYVIGGSNSSQQNYFGIIAEYDIKTNSWDSKENMPTPRSGFGTFVFQNKIYCIGGYSKDASYLGVNEVYNPISDTWETKTSMPTNRSGIQTKMVNETIYFLGGAIGYDYENSEIIFSQNNEAYVPITDSWARKTSIPVKGDFVAHVFEDKIYCVFKNSIQVYDTKQDSWSQKVSMPIPAINTYYSVLVENRIYFLLPNEGSYTQIYDMETDVWSFGENIPIEINQPSVVATSGSFAPKRIYMIGGFIGFVDATNATYVYDIIEDKWSLGASMTTSRYNIHVILVDDILYAIGGAIGFLVKPTGITTAVEKYIPADYIPEFPSWIILPLFLTATLIVVLVRKRLTRTRTSVS